MITTTKINVTETQNGQITKIMAQRQDNKPIDIVSFFKPYQNRGLKIKKLKYNIGSGLLLANLVPLNF